MIWTPVRASVCEIQLSEIRVQHRSIDGRPSNRPRRSKTVSIRQSGRSCLGSENRFDAAIARVAVRA